MKGFAMRYAVSLLTVLAIVSISGVTQASSDYRVSRYTSIAPVATSGQKDPLSAVVSVNFTDRVNTVGEAINHLLLRSGYRLADISVSDPALPILLSLPLPVVHRKLGPIVLENALATLAGDAWELVVDPVNRLISFELLEQFRNL
jgi:type IV pili sensor histidine kinase/response regulator